ncbi:MAG: chromate transporter [Oscillospiraceae bacterium]|nr:chromate transporter [Oscillospiraceae bacterium]
MKQLLQIFTVMFRIGLTTVGGGLVMLPQMTREYADRRGWVSRDELFDLFAVAQSLPGVIAVNASILVGYRLAKIKGAAAAVLGAVLPSLLVLIAVAVWYDRFIDNPFVLGALRAVRGCVVALLFCVSLDMRKKAFPDGKAGDRLFSIAIAAAALALAFLTRVNLIWIILGGAAAGLLYSAARRKGGRRDGAS